jgi:hypothetical protein
VLQLSSSKNQREVLTKFSEGDRVRIKSIAPGDTFTDRKIIGHLGRIGNEPDILCNNEVNYWFACETCTGTHYMHEIELELLIEKVYRQKAKNRLKNLC